LDIWSASRGHKTGSCDIDDDAAVERTGVGRLRHRSFPFLRSSDCLDQRKPVERRYLLSRFAQQPEKGKCIQSYRCRATSKPRHAARHQRFRVSIPIARGISGTGQVRGQSLHGKLKWTELLGRRLQRQHSLGAAAFSWTVFHMKDAISITLTLAVLTFAGAAKADGLLKLSRQGVQRAALLHQPASTVGHPAPVVIALHGLGGTGSDFEQWAGFDTVADREGFVAVYPDAIDGKWSYGRPIIAAMPMIGDEPVDDVGFLRLVIDELIDKKIADPGRIYVSGASRGGLMSYTLACALSDRIAAVAPMITGMTDHQIEDCHPGRPMPLMLIAGTNDNAQVYDGWIYAAGRQESVAETLEYWRVLDGCTGQEGSLLPRRNASDRTRVAVIKWTGCRRDTEVLLYKVIGGGHQLPSLAGTPNPMNEQKFGLRNHDIESAEEVWSFVKRFSLAAP
jgi:polyhydroxybutyrate depolymerase